MINGTIGRIGMQVDKDTVVQVIEDGIYYYNRFGEVGHLYHPDVSIQTITGTSGSKKCYFEWKDLGVKFYLTREEAQEKATQYLNSIPKHITKSLLKKICKLGKDKEFWIKNKYGIYNETTEHCFYDKNKLAFIQWVEYDDDYGGGYDEYVHPLEEYGITWALTKEELEKN